MIYIILGEQEALTSFFQAMEGIQCTETGWELGDNGIHIDRLILDSISCVSRGSWQPLLRLLP